MSILNFMPPAPAGSYLRGLYMAIGNDEAIKVVQELTRQEIAKGTHLYDAQNSIKTILLEKYGEQWYDKSAEAVQFIIEDTYCDAEDRSADMHWRTTEGVLW